MSPVVLNQNAVFFWLAGARCTSWLKVARRDGFDEQQRLAPESLLQMMRLGRKVQKLLALKDPSVAALSGTDD